MSGRAFIALVIAANAILLFVAWSDRSWTALGIAMFYGPISNLLLFALGMTLMKKTDDRSTIAFMLPPGAAILDYIAISVMGGSGC